MTLSKIKPYLQLMRLHQPVGIFLLLWPCLISLSFANRGHPDIKLILVFIIGSVLMRSAGCIINDLVDYDIDGKVKRTKTRPLANGKISFTNAIRLLVLLLLTSALLLLFLNKLSIIICLSSLILVIIYPFLKRYTYWAQLFLGVTYNIGVLVAWSAMQHKLTISAFLLYIGLIFWTLGYDTIYAHQDKEDDLKLGLKSTAIKFGDKTTKYLDWFYTITTIMLIFSGTTAKLDFHYYIYIIPAIALLFWQVQTLDIDNVSNCARRFKSNILVGGLIFIATIAAQGSL